MSQNESGKPSWNNIYKIGGVAALGAVFMAIVEILISFIPGGMETQETVVDWFMLFQDNWFLGLRNLGLINIFLNSLAILTFFALYIAHRQDINQPNAAIALIVSLLGLGVFFATNRAFPMLALSQEYATATTDAQRTILEAAGLSMLSVGQSHTPGTFLGFFLSEIAGIFISAVMLRSRIFGATAAYAGILGFGILMLFEILSSFVSGISGITFALALVGGLLSMAWYILIARKFFQLGRTSD